MVEGSQSPLIIKYEKALEEDPRSRAFAPLAEAYRKVGLIENAFKVLKKGIRYNPDYLLGYLTLAQCYFDKSEYALTYSTLRPLVPQNRDNIKLQRLFAESAYRTDNKEEALDTFKYILFLNPKDSESIEWVSRLEKELEEGVVYQPPEDIYFEIEDLRANPENDRALDDWVQVDLSRESSEEDDGIVHEAEEWSLEASSENRNAQAEMKVGEEESTPVITHTLVDLYLKQGHRDKAREILEKILEVQPDNEETKKRLAELNNLSNVAEQKVSSFEGDDSQTPLSSTDEGRDDLMAAFDKTVPRESQEGSSSFSRDTNNSQEFTKIIAPLNDFGTELKERARNHYRTP